MFSCSHQPEQMRCPAMCCGLFAGAWFAVHVSLCIKQSKQQKSLSPCLSKTVFYSLNVEQQMAPPKCRNRGGMTQHKEPRGHVSVIHMHMAVAGPWSSLHPSMQSVQHKAVGSFPGVRELPAPQAPALGEQKCKKTEHQRKEGGSPSSGCVTLC